MARSKSTDETEFTNLSRGVVHPEFRCDAAWLVSARGPLSRGQMQGTMSVRKRIKNQKCVHQIIYVGFQCTHHLQGRNVICIGKNGTDMGERRSIRKMKVLFLLKKKKNQTENSSEMLL